MRLRTCGLVAAAAMVVMAFLTASAMAESSVLCTSNESGQETCAEPNQLKSTNTNALHYVSSEMKILTDLQTVTCESLFLGTAFGLFTNAPVKIIGKFTYTNCNGSCKVDQLTEGELKLLKTTATEGTLVGTGVKIEVECFFLKCVFTWDGLSVGAKSANLPTTAGTLVVTKQELKNAGGAACPTMEKRLDMAMESLTDVYIKK